MDRLSWDGWLEHLAAEAEAGYDLSLGRRVDRKALENAMDATKLGSMAAEAMEQLARQFPANDAFIRNLVICVEIDGVDGDLHHITCSSDDRHYVQKAFLQECIYEIDDRMEEAEHRDD